MCLNYASVRKTGNEETSTLSLLGELTQDNACSFARLAFQRSHAFHLLGGMERLWPSPFLGVSPLLPLNSPLLSQDSNLSLHADNRTSLPASRTPCGLVPCAYLWAALPCYLLYLLGATMKAISSSHLSRLRRSRGSGLSCGWDWNVNESPFSPTLSDWTGFPSLTRPVLQGLPAGSTAQEIISGKFIQVSNNAVPTLEKLPASAQPGP